MSFIGRILCFFLERSARSKSYDDLIGSLRSSEDDVEQRILNASETPKNRDVICHIIGIERWGQRRLQAALGESLVMDEHDPYRPDATLDVQALAAEFATTRKESVALAEMLQQRKIPIKHRVAHNDLGDLSVGAWLAYLNGHAAREATRLRRT